MEKYNCQILEYASKQCKQSKEEFGAKRAIGLVQKAVARALLCFGIELIQVTGTLQDSTWKLLNYITINPENNCKLPYDTGLVNPVDNTLCRFPRTFNW